MCPEFEILSALVDGEVGSPWAQVIEEHCTSCKECCARLSSIKRLREAILSAPEPDWREPAKRVRSRIASREAHGASASLPVWRQRISIPVPAFALSIILLAGLGIFGFLGKTQPGKGTVTANQTGATEINISSEEVEALLDSLEKTGAPKEVIIRLPEGSKFDKVGEPELIHYVEYRGNR